MKHFKHLFCITDLQKYKTNTKHKLYLPDWIFCVYYDEYNEHNFIAKCQYNTTLLPSVNTIALGMFCSAKYIHPNKQTNKQQQKQTNDDKQTRFLGSIMQRRKAGVYI